MPFKPVDFDPFAISSQPIFADTTEPQREIWTSVQIGGNPANCAYNESVSLRLKGHLNINSLENAINCVIERHDALRSVFSADGTKMIVQPNLKLNVVITDLSNDLQKEEALNSIIQNEANTAFSLENGPLIRFQVLKLSQIEHMFIITAHHIICDGWSISIIMQDISAFYTAEITGISFQKDPAIQFSDYAKQELQKQPGNEHELTEKFWINQFDGVTETLELPIDKHRPALRTFNAKRIDVEFDMVTIDKVKQIGAKAGCSFVNTLTVAFEIFLYRLTGYDGIVLGIPSSGQSITGQYDLVGHCVNLLPLRSKMKSGIGFTDQLKSRKKEILDAFEHQQYTFGSLINKLNLPRDPGRIPLVPVIFNVDAGVFDGVKFSGLEINFYSNPRSFENFEIFINAASYSGKFIVECTFNTDLFDEDIMQLRMKEFHEMLVSIVSDPNASIDKLNLLSSDERQQLIYDLNKTSLDFPRHKGVHHLFEEAASMAVDLPAICTAKQTLSYKVLNEKADLLASHLLAIGVNTKTIVALCVDRTPDMVIALLAILKSGASYLPLDPVFPKDRIQFMLDDSNAGLLITQKQHTEKLGLKAKSIFLLDKDWENKIPQVTNQSEFLISENHLAYTIYTSGSTGKPKGVQVSHQSFHNLLFYFKNLLQVNQTDNLLAVTTISFDIAGLEIFLPLICGAQLTLAAKDEVSDAGKLLSIAMSSKATIIQATPVTWRMLLASGWKGSNSLTILCGGEALAADLASQLFPCCKNIWNVYGPTETTIWSTVYKLTPNEIIQTPFASIGKPLANTKVYILDKNLQPVPLGIAGELHIGGDGVSIGYLNRPDLNEERFIPDGFDDGKNKKLYKTGDLVRYRKDGNLEYINRMDNQVKVRGYRIELGEIESVLSRHPSILGNVVITRKDKSGENRLLGYFIVKPQQKVNEEKLRIHLQQHLPEYMIPAAFVEMKSFPLTPNGKIDRKALPDPDFQNSTKETFIESRTSNENLLASIWSELLGIQRISMVDDFFKLGGHSLLAVKLMMEIEKHRNIKLPLAILFTNSTIEKLARAMESEVGNKLWQSIVPIKTQGTKPPVYFAHGVSGNVFKYHALSKLLPADQPCYGLQAFGLNGKDIPFDNMEEMAAYHIKEILKFQPEGTSFSLAGGSFGGYLAYEMACQLKQMGKKVNLVAMFDIDAATAVDFLPAHQKYFKNTKILTERIFNRTVSFIKSDKEERNKYIVNKIKSLKSKNELDVWLDKDEVQRTGGAEQAAYFNKIEKACYKALMSYKIKSYEGNVILFRAKSGYYSAKFDFDLGWKHFAKGGVEVILVQGDHNSIFEKGNVEEMAEYFTQCLSKSLVS